MDCTVSCWCSLRERDASCLPENMCRTLSFMESWESWLMPLIPWKKTLKSQFSDKCWCWQFISSFWFPTCWGVVPVWSYGHSSPKPLHAFISTSWHFHYQFWERQKCLCCLAVKASSLRLLVPLCFVLEGYPWSPAAALHQLESFHTHSSANCLFLLQVVGITPGCFCILYVI